MKSKILLLVTSLAVLGVFGIATAQTPGPEHEEIILTTYYPAPYGDYVNLNILGNATSPALDVTPALTAGGSGDVLTAVHINPTFNDGGFSNVQHNGLIVENGNVGIGTITPEADLEIEADRTGNIPSTGSVWTRYINRNGSGTDVIFDVGANGGGMAVSQASILHSLNTPLIFQITNVPRVIIDTGGQVGIGTAPNLTSALHIMSLNDWSGTPGDGTGWHGGIRLSRKGNAMHGGGRSEWDIDVNYEGMFAIGDNIAIKDRIQISAGNFGGVPLFIDGSSGNVGIGTTSPTKRLHVIGSIKATGGVDPPFISFTSESHESIRQFAKEVTEEEKVMQFWNGETHRLEVYVIKEDKFYTVTGEPIEE